MRWPSLHTSLVLGAVNISVLQPIIGKRGRKIYTNSLSLAHLHDDGFNLCVGPSICMYCLPAYMCHMIINFVFHFDFIFPELSEFLFVKREYFNKKKLIFTTAFKHKFSTKKNDYAELQFEFDLTRRMFINDLCDERQWRVTYICADDDYNDTTTTPYTSAPHTHIWI